MLAASYAHLGRDEEAEAACKRGMSLQPRFSESTARMLSASADPDFIERFFGGLHKAGWTD